jgi:hypothetical protein
MALFSLAMLALTDPSTSPVEPSEEAVTRPIL